MGIRGFEFCLGAVVGITGIWAVAQIPNGPMAANREPSSLMVRQNAGPVNKLSGRPVPPAAAVPAGSALIAAVAATNAKNTAAVKKPLFDSKLELSGLQDANGKVVVKTPLYNVAQTNNGWIFSNLSKQRYVFADGKSLESEVVAESKDVKRFVHEKSRALSEQEFRDYLTLQLKYGTGTSPTWNGVRDSPKLDRLVDSWVKQVQGADPVVERKRLLDAEFPTTPTTPAPAAVPASAHGN